MHNNFVLTFSKKNANGMPKQKVKKKSATIVFFMRIETFFIEKNYVS